jgi:hypothetical protein
MKKKYTIDNKQTGGKPTPHYSLSAKNPTKKDSLNYKKAFDKYVAGDPMAREEWNLIANRTNLNSIPPALKDSVMDLWSAYSDADDQLTDMQYQKNIIDTGIGAKSAGAKMAAATLARIKAGVPPLKQTGGKAPIYTSNPNDPRLRNYNDSLAMYNATKNDINKIKTMSPEKWWDYANSWEKNNPSAVRAAARLTKLNGEKPMPVDEYTPEHREGDAALLYEKPVQPILFQERQLDHKGFPISKPNLSTNTGAPNADYKSLPQLNYTNPTKFSLTYPTSGNNNQQTMYFPDRSTWKRFNEAAKNVSSQEGEDYGTSTGYLDKMQTGGKGNTIPTFTGHKLSNIRAAYEQWQQLEKETGGTFTDSASNKRLNDITNIFEKNGVPKIVNGNTTEYDYGWIEELMRQNKPVSKPYIPRFADHNPIAQFNHPDLSTGTGAPQAGYKSLPQPNYDNPTKFSLTYPVAGNNNQKTMYFPNRSDWQRFNQVAKGVSTQEGSDYGTSTGYLDTKQYGGLSNIKPKNDPNIQYPEADVDENYPLPNINNPITDLKRKGLYEEQRGVDNNFYDGPSIQKAYDKSHRKDTPLFDKLNKFMSPSKAELNPFVKAFNIAALGATAIAGKVNDVRTNQDEMKQYLKSIVPEGYENMERYSLNTNPIFTKYGGKGKKYSAYQLGGNTKTFQSQQELDTANAQAKQFADRRSLLGDTYVGRKVGDPIPRYIDPTTGKDFVDGNTKRYSKAIPADVTPENLKSDGNSFWYEDPHTGDVVDVDPGLVLGNPRFKPTVQQQSADFLKRDQALAAKNSYTGIS